MYLEFYGFDKNPFHPSRDADFYFPSRSHREALIQLERGVAERGGMLLVTGSGGTGKSSLLEELARRAKKRPGATPILFTNPLVTFSKLVHTVHERLFPDKQPAASIEALLNQLRDELSSPRTRDWNVVLLIDEAQHIPTDTLAQLGRLLKIKSAAGRVVQIVLVGQQELEERFESRRLDHLAEFISARCRVTELEKDEIRAYVEHRLRVASASNQHFISPFANEVLEQIAERSDGRPANINRICHEALVTGSQYHERPIEMPTASLVLPEVDAPLKRKRKWLPRLIAATIALIAIIAAYMLSPRFRDSQANAAPVPSDRQVSSEVKPSAVETDPADVGTAAVDEAQDSARQSEIEEIETRVDSWVTALNELENEPRAVTWIKEEGIKEEGIEETVSREARKAGDLPSPDPPTPAVPLERDSEPQTTDTAIPEPTTLPAEDRSRIEEQNKSPVPGEEEVQEEAATISIAAYPIAEVFIDALPVGQTPLLALEVPIGRRFIEAVVDGRRQTRVEVLRRGEHRSITFRFDAEE